METMASVRAGGGVVAVWGRTAPRQHRHPASTSPASHGLATTATASTEVSCSYAGLLSNWRSIDVWNRFPIHFYP